MKGLKLMAGLLSLMVTAPIWYYLVYQMLVRVNASELMWFLYWIYLPLGIALSIINKVVEVHEGKTKP